MKISRYSLRLVESQTLTMPGGAHILTVQNHNEEPCLFVLCTSDAPPATRRFYVVRSETEVPADVTVRSYLGTVQIRGGLQTVHVFEVA